jgi:methionine sulfoxide reductase heme-binding subunit
METGEAAMTWLSADWRSVLNWLGLVIVTFVFVSGNSNWSARDSFDPSLESGKWAIRFLLLCLSITPANTFLGWRKAVNLRKPLGLWAFFFAVLHVFFMVLNDQQILFEHWLSFPLDLFIVLGIVGLVVLSVLAITSNRWAMKKLGKNWKRLHRVIYLGSIAIIFHALFATTMSKKMFVRDPDAAQELKIYLIILTVLLVVRIPPVRWLLIRLKQIRLKPGIFSTSTPE